MPKHVVLAREKGWVMIEPVSAHDRSEDDLDGGPMVASVASGAVAAVPISATIRPHILPRYSVRFFCLNERFAIELLRARTIRPKKLKLRRAASDMQAVMVEKSEAIILGYLGWTIPEKMARTVPFEQLLFVKLEGLARRESDSGFGANRSLLR
jgi:hypothetical protein